MKKIIITILTVVSIKASAGGVSTLPVKNSPWRLLSSLGYVGYSDFQSSDGNTASLRLAIARDLTQWRKLTFGAELGVQTGVSGKLNLPQDEVNILGGSALNATINPLVDLLFSVTQFNQSSTAFLYAKAGIAYRRMQFERENMADKTQYNPEVQIGFGYSISKNAALNIGYQGIFTKGLKLTTTGQIPFGAGTVNNIPSQHAGFLTFSLNA